MAPGHALRQPGEVPSQWHRNRLSPLHTPRPRFQRQQSGPWSLVGTALPQEARCGCRPAAPGRPHFLLDSGHCGAPPPLGLPLSSPAFQRILPSPQPTSPGTPAESGLTGRSSLGVTWSRVPSRPSPLEPHWGSFLGGPRNPRWVGGPLRVCTDSKCPCPAPHQSQCHQDAGSGADSHGRSREGRTTTFLT